MKTWKKFLLITGISLSLIGGLLALIGLRQGGLRDVANHLREDRNYVSTDLGQIKAINIDTFSRNIVIEETADKNASITYYQNKKSPITVSNDKGQLTIKNKDKVEINVFGLKDLGLIQLGRDIDTIVIKVPKGTKISKINAFNGLGDLDISKQSINDLEVSGNLGDLSIDQSQVKKGQLDLDTGDVEISNSQLADFDMTLSAGDVELDRVTLTNSSMDADTGDIDGSSLTFNKTNHISVETGEVDLELADYRLNISSDSEVGDEDITDELSTSHDNFLDIQADTGDISVD